MVPLKEEIFGEESGLLSIKKRTNNEKDITHFGSFH
jgi:hypothetical protein